MTLDRDALKEIKTYMDERSEHWRAETHNTATTQIADEFAKREERSSRRTQTIVTIVGVSIATLLGGTYLWINSFIETHANTKFEALKQEFVANREERLVELKEELSFLSGQVKGVVAAKVSVGNAVTDANDAVNEAKEKIQELKTLEIEISDNAKAAEDLVESAQISIERSSKLIAQSEDRLPLLDSVIEEINAKLRVVQELDAGLVGARKLSEGIKNAEGDVVTAILANTDLQERLVAQAAFPSRAVVAFTAGSLGQSICPEGWSYYKKAENRFILGADELKYQIGVTGGAESVALTISEMPTHSHPILRTSSNSGDGNYVNWAAMGSPNNKSTGSGTAPVGDSQPHNNMPPYIALYFCKKD